MELKQRRIYLIMFKFLDNYWEETKHMDSIHNDLGDLLSGMNPIHPFVKTRGMPIDLALVADWNVIVGDKEQLNAEEGYEAMLRFLEKQRDWQQLDPIIAELERDYENREGWWKKWLEIYNKVKEE